MKKAENSTMAKRIWITVFLLFGLLVLGTLFAAILGADIETTGANTAIIKIEGPISTSGASWLSDSTATSGEIVRELEKARDDDTIKAVILEINSPGGSAVASDEIAQAVKDVRAANKTVVAWIREEGASGAYWVASSSDHIIANRMSITGSIGVISSYLQFDQFITSWNVSYNRLVAGDRKDVGDPFVNLTESNKLFLQAKLNRVHGFFIDEIAKNRNMSTERVTSLADGQFFLGVEALDAGLVDQLGGKPEAIAYIEKSRGIAVTTVDYAPEKSFMDELLGVFGKQQPPSVVDMARSQSMRDDAPIPMLR